MSLGRKIDLFEKVNIEEGHEFLERFRLLEEEVSYIEDILPKIKSRKGSENLLYIPINELIDYAKDICKYCKDLYESEGDINNFHHYLHNVLIHENHQDYDQGIEQLVYLPHSKTKLREIISNLKSILNQRIYYRNLPNFFTDAFTLSQFQNHSMIFYSCDGVSIDYFTKLPKWIRPTSCISIFDRQSLGISYYGDLREGDKYDKKKRVAITYMPYHAFYRTRFLSYMAHEVGHIFTHFGRKAEDITLGSIYNKQGKKLSILNEWLREIDGLYDSVLKSNFRNESLGNTKEQITDEIVADFFGYRIGGPAFGLALLSDPNHKFSLLRGFENENFRLTSSTVSMFTRFLLMGKFFDEIFMDYFNYEDFFTFGSIYDEIFKRLNQSENKITNKFLLDLDNIMENVYYSLFGIEDNIDISTYEKKDWKNSIDAYLSIVQNGGDLNNLKPRDILNIAWIKRLRADEDCIGEEWANKIVLSLGNYFIKHRTKDMEAWD